MPRKLIFERIEKGRAYLKDEENKTVILPESYIDKNFKEGDQVFIEVSKESSTAIDILNELLSTDK